MKLGREFYQRPTLEVAKSLLGKVLVRRLNGKRLAGKIVETEAYIGQEDLACHASKGRTPRTSILFAPGGCAYVYMIYGFYFCLNVVTEAEGFPAAVLIRAMEPLAHATVMRGLRKDPRRDIDIASGPGKLCMAMAIDKKLNGEELTGNTLWIEDRQLEVGRIERTPRIGVDYAGEYRDKPWRFFAGESVHVSRVKLSQNT